MPSDFFIIGAPKSGTTALSEYLDAHEEVCFSSIKEPFFFSSDYPGLIKINGSYSLEEYSNLFSCSEKLKGEGSTNYLASKTAVVNILKFNPDAKFIVMLRNPVEAAYAFHGELLHSLDEDQQSFIKAWELQSERKKGECIPKNCSAEQFLQYGEHFLYGEQVARLLERVKRENVKFIFFEDFAKNTEQVYSEVLNFLGLKYTKKINFEPKYAAGRQRFEFLAKLMLRPPERIAPAVKKIRNFYRTNDFPLKKQIKNLTRKKVDREALPESFKNKLKCFYKDDLMKLEKILDVNLEEWYKIS